MTSLQERIADERRRLRSVRLGMLATIERQLGDDANLVPFYIAAANYIDETMQRVHDQDVKMDAMIREKVEKVDETVENALGELKARLDNAQIHLQPFIAARDQLIEQGSEALTNFEREGKIYSDFIVSNMGHHPPTADLGSRLFSAEDWEYMAGATQEEIQKEQELYKSFTNTLPETPE